MNHHQDVEFMDRLQLKQEIHRLRATQNAATALLQSWIDKQGHDRCWYYPEIFEQLIDVYGVKATLPPNKPPRAEFRGGCRRYEDEQFGESADVPVDYNDVKFS